MTTQMDFADIHSDGDDILENGTMEIILENEIYSCSSTEFKMSVDEHEYMDMDSNENPDILFR